MSRRAAPPERIGPTPERRAKGDIGTDQISLAGERSVVKRGGQGALMALNRSTMATGRQKEVAGYLEGLAHRMALSGRIISVYGDFVGGGDDGPSDVAYRARTTWRQIAADLSEPDRRLLCQVALVDPLMTLEAVGHWLTGKRNRSDCIAVAVYALARALDAVDETGHAP